MPDAAMLELATTGWINFRVRQMVILYGVQLLQLPPVEVGAALAEMFDDYELHITWPQVAINDGRIDQEKGPRILNPVNEATIWTRPKPTFDTGCRNWQRCKARSVPGGLSSHAR